MRVLGVDMGKPGGDETVYTTATITMAGVTIIDPLTDDQRADLEDFYGRSVNKALEASFRQHHEEHINKMAEACLRGEVYLP
jgi:hypothetical protein